MIHSLTAGLPRLLQAAHDPRCCGLNITLACGAYSGLLTCFNTFISEATKLYSRADSVGLRIAYSCFLVSATKYPVADLDAAVPLLPAETDADKNSTSTTAGETKKEVTFRHAIELSIGMYSHDESQGTAYFVVPPLIGLSLNLNCLKVPVSPAALFPFECLKDRMKLGPVGRGVPFEELFLNALHARYYVACWQSKTSGGLVPLENVLKGAVADDPLLKGVEVDLSGGVRSEQQPICDATSVDLSSTCILWNNDRVKATNAHHDAYIVGHRNGRKFAVGLSMRHRQPKEASKIERQLRTSAQDPDKYELLLIVCNGQQDLSTVPTAVAFDSSRICYDTWLSHISPISEKKKERKGD